MKKLSLVLLTLLLLSCGGERDIVKKLQGRYIAIDQKERELYYGLTIDDRSNFTLWYMAKSGKLKEELYSLDDLEIINQYRYFYANDRYPTWVYIYSSNSAPFNLRILEDHTGELELRLQFKPEHPIHNLDLDYREINLIGRDSLDSFKYYTKIILSDHNLPELTEIISNPFINKNEMSINNIRTLYNTIYLCTGRVVDHFYKKNSGTYLNNNAVTWEEYTVMEIDGSNPPLYIEFKTSEQLTNEEAFTYDLNSPLTKSVKIRSFKYIDDDKTSILLRGEINLGSYIDDINAE